MVADQMQALRNFLNYVEIQTKIASVFPFLVGIGYTLYRHGSINGRLSGLFFVAMILFDMTCTSINNHVGRRETSETPHYSTLVSLGIIVVMGLSATVLGIWLALEAGIVILLTGVFCFGMGVIYNYGPLPVSRTPFGELVSGAVMGICIPFIACQINQPIVEINWYQPMMEIKVNLFEVLLLGIIVLPLICCISNIMLANNLCDLEDDVRVGRYTLPFYVGVQNGLRLYAAVYYCAFLAIAVSVLIGALPPVTLVVLLAIFPVRKNIRKMEERQVKKDVFPTTIQNFMLICASYTVCIWLGYLLQ